MTHASLLRLPSSAVLGMLGACSSEPIAPALRAPTPMPRLAQDEAIFYSAWSEPVNVGHPINTAFVEQGASLSRDGLELYFQCRDCPWNVPGSLPGTTDIYVARRASADAPWEAPQPLSLINTIHSDVGPRVSLDGHRLFFNSDRPGGHGGMDLYVSRRRGNGDHTAWRAPVNLGPDVNTSGDEFQPEPFEDEAGISVLYYTVGPNGGNDIVVSAQRPDGTYGLGVPVAELNTSAVERQAHLRRDGLEIYFSSNRAPGLGALDLWKSTRATTRDPWSAPVNLDAPLNTSGSEARPVLSFDGRALYFQSTRGGAVGCDDGPPCAFDLWVSTRRMLRDER